MSIKLYRSPQRRDDQLQVSTDGETLFLNATGFDLSGITDPTQIESEFIIGPAFRLDGDVHVRVVTPYGAEEPVPEEDEMPELPQEPAPAAPVQLCQIAGARLVVDQDAWEVTGVERSTGIAGAWLEDTDVAVVLLAEPQHNTFYDVVPSEGVTKFNDYLVVERPGMTELSFIVQRVQ